MARTKTPPTDSSVDRTSAYAEAVLRGEIVAGPHVRNACRRHLDDLKRTDGIKFEVGAANDAFEYFEEVLKLSEGQFEGQPFLLHPSQAFIIGSLFGWKRPDGRRRFRRAYIEQGKGNGKSPLAGGIGLLGLAADDESGAQIYAAAAKREQAQILFADAVKMVKQSPALARRLEFSGGPGREFNIAHHPSGSFFRPVSRDTGRTGSGPRPYFVLADEVHELPDRSIIEMLERGFKFRREPLLFMITNSGSDRNSVAWEEHEHAIKVAAGNIDAVTDPTYLGNVIDDTTFSYVCSLDTARTEVYEFDIALRRMSESCSCKSCIAQITLSGLPSPQDFAALVTQEKDGPIISPKGSGALITPSVRLFLDAFATLATLGGAKRTTQSEASSAARLCGSTPRASGPKNSLEKETPSTESEGQSPTQRGRSTELGSQSMELPPSKSVGSGTNKAADAGSAKTKPSVSGWITATIQELLGDCSAIPAMQGLVCSEIISRLYSAHSTTCGIHQQFRLESGRLKADLPADDPLTDPTCWVKANPLLGVTITEEYLREIVAQARSIPGQLNGILRLHFCVWTDAETAWMTREAVEPCIAEFDISEHRGKEIWLGLDLSRNRDITALGAVVKTGTNADGKPLFDAWIEAWTPGDTLAAREIKDKIPYRLWVDEGHLHAPPGENINYRHVVQTLAEYNDWYKIQLVAYDRFAFKRFEEDVNEIGLSLVFAEHAQGGLKKGKPLKEGGEGLWMPGSIRLLEDAISERRIRLKKNTALFSAMMSAVIEEDKWGNHWLAKTRSFNKIDAAIALAMALGAASADEGVRFDITAMVA